MDLIEQYRALARYNSWMNRKLYLLSAALNDDQRKRDRGAFFRSIHGTLNHLLLTDRVQVSRFVAQPLVSRDQHGNAIEIRALSQELYADFEILRRQREETDRFIEGWTQTLTPIRSLATCTTVLWPTGTGIGTPGGGRSRTCSTIRRIIGDKSPRCSGKRGLTRA